MFVPRKDGLPPARHPVEPTSAGPVPDYCTRNRYTEGPFGIVNKWGNFWSHDTFMSVDAAWDRLRAFWSGKPEMLAGYRVVPVVVTVSELRAEEPTGASRAEGEQASKNTTPQGEES